MLTAENRPWRIKRGWMSLAVTGIQDETSDTKTFLFEDAEEGGRTFDYRAGQYLTFRYDDINSTKPPVRSYTMSSAPCDGNQIAVTVKRVQGGLVSNWMCNALKVGSVLRARGPIGRFCYDPESDQQRLVMVAAGSGVTPFVSIMKDLSATAPSVAAILLVAYRTSRDIICAGDLATLARNPRMRVQMTFSREAADSLPSEYWHGRISSQHIDRVCDPLRGGDSFANTTFMTCGPDDMMATVVAHLRTQGVPESCIKQESFAS